MHRGELGVPMVDAAVKRTSANHIDSDHDRVHDLAYRLGYATSETIVLADRDWLWAGTDGVIAQDLGHCVGVIVHACSRLVQCCDCATIASNTTDVTKHMERTWEAYKAIWQSPRHRELIELREATDQEFISDELLRPRSILLDPVWSDFRNSIGVLQNSLPASAQARMRVGSLVAESIHLAPLAVQQDPILGEDYPIAALDLAVTELRHLVEPCRTLEVADVSQPIGLAEYIQHGRRPICGMHRRIETLLQPQGRPNGPEEPCYFWWDQQRHELHLPPRLWQLLKLIWNREQIAIEEIGGACYGSRWTSYDRMRADVSRLKTAVMGKLPLTWDKPNRQLFLVRTITP